MTNITFLRRFGTYKSVRPSNLVTREEARKSFEKGEMIVLAYGPHDAFYFFVEVFNRMNSIDVGRMSNGKVTELIHVVNGARHARPGEMFVTEYKSRLADGSYDYDLFFGDAYVDGDYPRFSTAGPPPTIQAVAADFKTCWIGGKPDFEALCDGSFVKRLPRIERPPEDLIAEFVPQDQRTKTTPKRAPLRVWPETSPHFPNGVPAPAMAPQADPPGTDAPDGRSQS